MGLGSLASTGPRVYVLLLQQDDPKKCTAAKLSKFRLATPLHRLRQVPRQALVLSPFADNVLLPNDRVHSINFGLVAIDCSWERADDVLASRLPGLGRRLPTLLAANPTNYETTQALLSRGTSSSTLYRRIQERNHKTTFTIQMGRNLPNVKRRTPRSLLTRNQSGSNATRGITILLGLCGCFVSFRENLDFVIFLFAFSALRESRPRGNAFACHPFAVSSNPLVFRSTDFRLYHFIFLFARMTHRDGIRIVCVINPSHCAMAPRTLHDK